MTVREYLNKRLQRSKEWQSNNILNSLYYAYANVEISLLESIINDFESIMEMEISESI